MKRFKTFTIKEEHDRTSFVYMAPKNPKGEFAQCGTCRSFMPESQRCSLFSKGFKVVAEASCTLYAHGTPHEQEFSNSTTPKEAGYVTGEVRCENCKWFLKGDCTFFGMLNDKLPKEFDLDVKVDPKGCCNAWEG